jgi:hypothetical protein
MKLKLYRVELGCDITPIFKDFEIEAESKEEAIELAKKEFYDSNWENEVEIEDFGSIEVEKL